MTTSDAALSLTPSARARRAGWILSGLLGAFFVMGAGFALSANPEALKGTVELGWPPSLVPVLGTLELVLVVLYLVPRTAVLGAVLWTGFFGGAVATHLRLEQPLFTQVLMPVYVATLLWVALWLRDERVRRMLAKP